jgi:fluoroacetyl-CoA thioesterase
MNSRGRTAEATLAVSPPGTAEATHMSPHGGFPAVLPLSRLTELMELACVRLMQPRLHGGESSLAIEMNVTHCAPLRRHESAPERESHGAPARQRGSELPERASAPPAPSPDARARAAGRVRAVASYRGIYGRLHHFTANVFDETGLIASAEHTRAVVPERALLGSARRRAQRASLQLGV